ncbi:MAG: LysR family transcriptional regulator [Kordiimonas sp.]|nr:LysR family transcriptional regulator [Kordiimonas sp.]|tara:strand:- start:62 stop:949 length:888 start_codon:yes stop_codon:yes gene_type:complete
MRDWTGIEEFVEVAEAESFSRGAAQLGVSKSQVSKRIRHLEDRLGARLFNRTTRSISLTEIGRGYLEHCKKLIENLEDAELALKNKQENPIGLVRMTVAGAFGEDYIVPLCADFMTQYPQVEIEIDFSNRAVDLIEEHYDLAIRTGALPDKTSHIVKKLTAFRLITCASPGYLDKFGIPENPNQLSNHACLVGTLPFWRFLREDRSGSLELRVTGPWRSNNGHALVNAAKANLGITQLPEFYVRPEIKAGRLIPFLEDWTVDDIPVWAVYPHRQYLPTKVRLFINYVSQKLPAKL